MKKIPAILLIFCFLNSFGQMPADLEGWAIMTSNGINPTDPVFRLKNVKPVSTVPPNSNWIPDKVEMPNWVFSRLGQVFGVAIDSSDDFYLAAGRVYSGGNNNNGTNWTQTAGAGGIYKVSGNTGAVSDLVTTAAFDATDSYLLGKSEIPNFNWGLGNICYNRKRDILYASNLEDGRIYTINKTTGEILHIYDPIHPGNYLGALNPPLIADNRDSLIAPEGDRIWAIGYNLDHHRLYFSVWVEDIFTANLGQNNAVFSVGVNSLGFPTGSVKPEFLMSDIAGRDFSSPIADIAFSSDGLEMLVAEKSMNPSGNPNQTSAHQARAFKYAYNGANWLLDQRVFVGNNSANSLNCSGGCDYGYDESVCDTMLWFSGDGLFQITPAQNVYGFYGTHQPGNETGTYFTDGYFIDNDEEYTLTSDKTSLGDIEIFNSDCECLSPFLELGNDTSMCIGDTIVLNAAERKVDYLWQDGSTDSIFTIVEPGKYYVSLTHLCGLVSDTIEVTLKSQIPTVNLGKDTTLCETEHLDLDVSFPNATYLWQDGSTSPVYRIDFTGLYWVQIQTSCGLVRDSIQVDFQNIIFPPDLGPDRWICQGNSTQLNASYPGVKYLWSTGVQTNSISVNSAGEYWVKLFNACDTLADTIVIYADTIAPDLNLGPDSILCDGDSLILTAISQNGNYSWSDGSTDSVLIAKTTGLYFVEVTNACGYDIDAVELTFNNGISPFSLGQDTVICLGDSIIIAPSNFQGNYLWSTGSTDSTILTYISGLYWLEQNNNCDTLRDSIIISQYLVLPNPDLGKDTTLCLGQTLDYNFNHPGIQYLWSDGSDSNGFQITSAGQYWVQFYTHCDTLRDTVIVQFQGSIPMFDLGKDTNLCFGQTLEIKLPDSLGIFMWSNGSADSAISISNNGTYWLDISNDCATVRDSISVYFFTNPPQFSLPIDTVLCQGEALVVSASDSGAIYLWSDGSTDTSLSIDSTGWYWLEMQNPCGILRDSIYVGFDTLLTPRPMDEKLEYCAISMNGVLLSPEIWGLMPIWSTGDTADSIRVYDADVYWYYASNTCGFITDTTELYADVEIPMVYLPADTTLCEGDTFLVQASNSPHPYLWSDSSTASSLRVTTEAWYWVEVTNFCGTDRDSIYVAFESPLSVFDLGADTVLCNGDSVWLYVSGLVNHTWNDGSSSDSVLIDSTGIYWVAQINNCGTLRDSIEVSFVDPILPIAIGKDTSVCIGSNVVLSVIGTHPNVLWSTGETDTSIVVNTTNWYWVQSTNTCGVEVDSIYIKVDTNFTDLKLGPDTVLCAGDSLALTVPMIDATWIWSTGSSDSIIYISQNATVSLQMFNACDTLSDSINVLFQGSLPVFTLPADTLICELDSFTLNYSYPGATNLWSDGETDSNMTIDTTGLYWLSMYNECGTVADSINVIELLPLSLIDLGDDTTVCEYTDITFDVGQYGVSYLWNDNSTDSFMLAQNEGIYWVEASNQCGLIRDSVEVLWSYCKCELYIANAFTPNGDGMNEEFGPSSTCQFLEYHFMIFDRWGQMIFESYDQHEWWNGTIGGEAPKEDVYAWELIWTYPNQEAHHKAGRVSLIR